MIRTDERPTPPPKRAVPAWVARKNAGLLPVKITGYANPDGSSRGDWSEVERRRVCRSCGQTHGRISYQQASPVEPAITPLRFLVLLAVGVLMWVAIAAGIFAMAVR